MTNMYTFYAKSWSPSCRNYGKRLRRGCFVQVQIKVFSQTNRDISWKICSPRPKFSTKMVAYNDNISVADLFKNKMYLAQLFTLRENTCLWRHRLLQKSDCFAMLGIMKAHADITVNRRSKKCGLCFFVLFYIVFHTHQCRMGLKKNRKIRKGPWVRDWTLN